MKHLAGNRRNIGINGACGMEAGTVVGIPKLQTQFAHRIVAEQLAFANVAPNHLSGFVAGLSHHGSLAGSVARCLRPKDYD